MRPMKCLYFLAGEPNEFASIPPRGEIQRKESFIPDSKPNHQQLLDVAYPRRIVVVVIVVTSPLVVVDTPPVVPTRRPPRSNGRRTRDATGAVADPCYCPAAASRAVPPCRGCSILHP